MNELEPDYADELALELKKRYETDPHFRELATMVGSTLSALNIFFTKVDVGSVLVKIGDAVNKIKDHHAKVYPEIVDNLSFFADHNWFISLSIPAKNFRQQALCGNREGSNPDNMLELDKKFIEFYEGWFKELCTIITKKHPKRTFILEQAFRAHKREEYALSIPVFLAQADGILAETSRMELFSSRDSIYKHLNDSKTSAIEGNVFSAAMWTPLMQERPIAWSSGKRRDNNYTGFNRNTVMHGIDVEYATLKNSLKAFSLLAYVVSLRNLIEEVPA